MNTYVDYVYLSLELTKLFLSQSDMFYDRDEIVNVFKDNMKDILELKGIEDLDTILKEYQTLKENSEKKKMFQFDESNKSMSSENVSKMINYIEDNKTNMEPYISTYLLSELKKYI